MKSILIIYPSWEDRSHLGFQSYISKYNQIDEIYLLEMKNTKHAEKTNLCIDKIVRSAEELSKKVKRTPLSNEDKELFNIIKSLIDGLDTTDNIFLDITTMSRNILWTLLFFIKQNHNKIKIIYSKPHTYNGDWISREPSTPNLLIKHSGILDLDLKTCLVIVTGFDTDRTKQLVKFYEPHKIVLLVQSGCDFKNDRRNNGNEHKAVCEEIGHNPSNIEVLIVDSYSDDFGFNTIETSIKTNKLDHNVILASLGPKLSAISIYQIHSNNPEIGLSYVPCKEYNPDYCSGIGETIIKDITL